MSDKIEQIKLIHTSRFYFNYKNKKYRLIFSPSLIPGQGYEEKFNISLYEKKVILKIFSYYKKAWLGSQIYSSSEPNLLIQDHVKSLFMAEYRLMIDYHKKWGG